MVQIMLISAGAFNKNVSTISCPVCSEISPAAGTLLFVG
jgi:hypothetical protein